MCVVSCVACLQRIVRLGGAVDDDMANLLVAQLLYLDAVDNKKDITMYVNSPGGSVTAGASARVNKAWPLSQLGYPNWTRAAKPLLLSTQCEWERLMASIHTAW